MITGYPGNLQDISDTRKTAVIDWGLSRLQMDTVALQETRLLGLGSVRERDLTFFWQEKSPDETRELGVSFAVKNSL